MKTKIVKTFFFCLLFATSSIVCAEPLVWKYATQGIIASSPVIDDTIVYFGSADSTLYALHSGDGSVCWSYKTEGSIKSKPAIGDTAVYVCSNNKLYTLNKITGNLFWEYTPASHTPYVKIDNWDYHQASPEVVQNNVYYGDESGTIHGIDRTTGEMVFSYTTTEGSPVRAGVTIVGDTLIFGDWTGWVYAVKLSDESLIWQYKSFDSPGYPEFGPVLSKPLVYEQMVFVGARNDVLSAIDINNGTAVWTYTDPIGSWISGEPTIENDTLYIGGSDNREMLALNPETGTLHWKYKNQGNMFVKPYYREGILIYGDGDSYDHHTGFGYLYFLNAKNGVLINIYNPGRNVYSSVTVKENMAYFGCYDNNLYCINIDSVIHGKVQNITCTEEPESSINITTSSNANVVFTIANQGFAVDSIMCSMETEDELIREGIRFSPSEFQIFPQDEKQIKLIVMGSKIPPGEYNFVISVRAKSLPGDILTRSCTLTVVDPASIKHSTGSDLVKLYPNPVRDHICISLHTKEPSLFNVEIYTLGGRLIHQEQQWFQTAGEQIYKLHLTPQLMMEEFYIAKISINNHFIDNYTYTVLRQ